MELAEGLKVKLTSFHLIIYEMVETARGVTGRKCFKLVKCILYLSNTVTYTNTAGSKYKTRVKITKTFNNSALHLNCILVLTDILGL